MTLELGLAAAFALIAIFCGALGFSGTQSRTATVARALFYTIVLVTLVSLVVGLLGVSQFI
ncbi:MAG: DUF1328 domain-containing protein [Ottowia sp.]|nr:DUF1328 domain-containing protein [Ottowia sp.]